MSELEVYEPQSVTLFRTDDPAEIVARAKAVAEPLADVIEKQRLFVTISGRKYVRVEGWQLLGTMLGVFPYLIWSRRYSQLVPDSPVNTEGWEARVEARTRSGEPVGAAEAMCLDSESTWARRDAYALRSMAQTRATSKALRQPLGFVMSLAGYEATPAEEMPVEDSQSRGELAQDSAKRQPVPPPASPTPTGETPPYATPTQVSQLRAMVRKLIKQGRTEAELRAATLHPHQVDGFGKLTEDQADAALQTLMDLDTEEIPF